MSPDLPFVFRKGDELYNRIAVIDRIQYLTGVDLRDKSASYLKAMDLEMWKRWYSKENPLKTVDEEFCQRASTVIIDMESSLNQLDDTEYSNAKKEYEAKLQGAASADLHSKDNPSIVTEANQPVKN